MEVQEYGGVESKKGKHGVAIQTSYSAGQGRAGKRTRNAMASRRINRITTNKTRRRAANQKQANLFAVQDAVTSGNRFVFLDGIGAKRKKGIFKVIGGKKNFKKGWPKGAKIEMVADLTELSVRIPRNPWLSPAVDEAATMMPAFYADALRFQLKRLGAK